MSVELTLATAYVLYFRSVYVNPSVGPSTSTTTDSSRRCPQNIQEPHQPQPHRKLRLYAQVPPLLPIPNALPQPHRNPSRPRRLRPLCQPIHPSPRCGRRRRRSFRRRLSRHRAALGLILRLSRFALRGQRYGLGLTVTIVPVSGIGASTATGTGSSCW